MRDTDRMQLTWRFVSAVRGYDVADGGAKAPQVGAAVASPGKWLIGRDAGHARRDSSKGELVHGFHHRADLQIALIRRANPPGEHWLTEDARDDSRDYDCGDKHVLPHYTKC
ncbi:MAG: hypothetical protein M3Q69_00050 [Acidobacteriota bacterium]|nr:hypothetical protein [Acidobacteriota bacterium]